MLPCDRELSIVIGVVLFEVIVPIHVPGERALFQEFTATVESSSRLFVSFLCSFHGIEL
jgi:hypothetical protein